MKNKIVLVSFLVIASIVLTGCNENDIESTEGILGGMVTDAISGEPVRGVSVSIIPIGFTSVTGNEGMYEFRDIEAGNYLLQFEKSGYVTYSRQVTVVAGKITNGDCMLTQDVIKIKLNVSELNFEAKHNSLTFNIENPNASKSVSWQISNIPTYLTLSSTSGSIGIGKSVSIVATLNRAMLTEKISTHLIISSEGESMSLSISAELAMQATVKTQAVTNITTTSAQVEGVVITNGNPPITERGICYSTSRFPTINNSCIPVSGVSTGSFIATLTGLSSNTSYCARTYAINEIGVAYGEEIWFETLSSSAIVSIIDFLSISDGLYFYFSPSLDTEAYYWNIFSLEELPDNDEDIIEDLLVNGINMDINGLQEGYSWDLDELTKYTLCVVAYDSQNRQGKLIKKEVTTKSSVNQPLANITINTITANSVNFTMTRNSFCASYAYAGRYTDDDELDDTPDILWAHYCYEDYKDGDIERVNQMASFSFSDLTTYSKGIIITLGFNSNGVNSGVIDKKFYSIETKSEILRSSNLKAAYNESKSCKQMDIAKKQKILYLRK